MVALVQIKVKRYGRLFDVEGNIKNDLFEIIQDRHLLENPGKS